MKNFLLLALLLIIIYDSNSQNESGTRYLNKERFQQQHIWLDSSTQVYQTCFPIIRNIPPLSTGMTYDVLLGYIYLDSLLRFANRHIFDSTLSSCTTLNDTVKWALKYLYIINDFNPIIFNQYINEVRFYQSRGIKNIKLIGDPYDTLSPTQGRYNLDLWHLKYDICEKFREIYPNQSKKAYYSILYADYILRIQILAIDSMINKNSSLNYYRYNVSAMVIDTLKGKIIPEFMQNAIVKKHLISDPNPNYLFNFQFTQYGYGMFNTDNQIPLYSKPDTAFSDGWKFRMRVGQEAIIFITFENPKYDFQNDYFDLDLEPRCSLNALRVENGNVFDINNVWSSQTIIPYQDWKQIYINLQNNITNITY